LEGPGPATTRPAPGGGGSGQVVLLRGPLYGRGLDQRSRLGGAGPRRQSGPAAERASADGVHGARLAVL